MAKKTGRDKPSTATTRILLGITALGFTAFVASVGFVSYLLSQEDWGEVEEGSFLSLELSGVIPDAPAQGGLFLEPDDFPVLVTEYAAGIRAAAEDDRIEGLYLELGGTSAGYAGLHEIRAALDDFRASGKPCVAYSEAFSMGSYYLASACDAVVMAPSGVNMVNGLAASVTYYAGTMEKLGVVAEMEHVGDFKSAVEPFERSEPSEAASEAMNYLLDGLYDQMVADIAAGRGQDEAVVRGWIDRPALSPAAALERGMVDALAFPDVVRSRAGQVASEGWTATLVEEAPEDEETSFTSFGEYMKGVRAREKGREAYVAVIHADGQIVSGDPDGGLFGGDSMLADKPFARWMKKARESDEVKAVVLRVNSPGGSGLASDMMWREIVRTQAAGKPVVVSMANYAASGGYFISAPADWIVADPLTITGSIGVFGGKMNLSGTYEKLGMTTHTYERGAEADLFSPNSGFSEEGRQAYRRFLSDFYDVFLGKVSEGREMSEEEVHAVAKGRVWTGGQAIERGLVDELGGLDEAVSKAAELASLDPEAETWGIRRLPEQKGFIDLLMEDLQKSAAAPTLKVDLGLPGVAEDELRDLVLLDRILADGVAALLPGGLELAE